MVEMVGDRLEERDGGVGGEGGSPEQFADGRVVLGDCPGDVGAVPGLVVELGPDREGFVHGDGCLVAPGSVFGPLGLGVEEVVEELLVLPGAGGHRRGRGRSLGGCRDCHAAKGLADVLFEFG
ncbi:hypothetical protein [Streptomyces yangpuensis]|uniref:hypothetical protein n=1 Tax=Streptomyces yangpuensis TaxID=1648182 RepID=UPI00365F6C56